MGTSVITTFARCDACGELRAVQVTPASSGSSQGATYECPVHGIFRLST